MEPEKRFWGDLFPTKLSAAVFVAYIGFFVNQGILVTATKDAHNKYNYSITAVVMFTECLKLVISSVMYLKDHSFRQLLAEVVRHKKVLGLYFVPALLYCFYNNLAFVNLATFDPTTYNLLLQFRVVITGVLFQMLFQKKLSLNQWLSLILLTLGCIVKELSAPTRHMSSSDGSFWGSIFSVSVLFLLIQMLCSCFAGVYNEFLLKNTGVDIHIMVHNVFMYIDSIVCNLAVLVFRGEVSSAFSAHSFSTLLQGKVVAVMVNGAICGIVTSVFLKNLNSILKTFASALDLSFTAILCWVIFRIPIDVYTVAAIVIVSFATYLYSRQPVVNKPREVRSEHDSDAEQKDGLLNCRKVENV